ncbi:DUF4044 domain-containing protein [Levilactobacillus brevis]|nr:DUF4044 domain-containing protein [Levilactobacillus brevis]
MNISKITNVFVWIMILATIGSLVFGAISSLGLMG